MTVEGYTHELEKRLALITATYHVYAHEHATMQSTSFESLETQTEFDLCTCISVPYLYELLLLTNKQMIKQMAKLIIIINSVFESVGLPCITVHIPMLSYLSPTTITGDSVWWSVT